MTNVLHIGAADGEIEFYSRLGVKKLVYSEPDKKCLISLSENIRTFVSSGSSMEILVVPLACSSKSGEKLTFYANGLGQSSIEPPGPRTFEMVGNHFDNYTVDTVSLPDLKESTFRNDLVHYCCIDTQGHEKSILCGVDPQYLKDHFMVIDVEIMTDTGQYSVPQNNWKEVVFHLLRSGFEPLVHPHGITESYIFVNSSISSCYFESSVSAIRDRLMQDFLRQAGIMLDKEKCNVYSSLGDHSFLPFTHIGGTIHASLLQPFREQFVRSYLGSLVAQLSY